MMKQFIQFVTQNTNIPEENVLPVTLAIVVVSLVTILLGVFNGSKKPKTKLFLDPNDKSDKQVKLGEIIDISHDTKLFRFTLPSPTMALGLPIGKHVKLTCPNPNINGDTWNGMPDPDKKDTIERKYTPTSSNKDLGHFDLVVKIYKRGVVERFPDGGKMSQYLASLKVGDNVTVSGPWGLNEYHGCGKITRGKKEFQVDSIGMISGGTGITPMLQVLAHILNNPKDTTKVSLIFANQTEDDILVRDMLEKYAKEYPEQFKLHYTLDRPPTDWKYSEGFVTDEMINKHLPGPKENCVVLMCGPPPMIKFACKQNLEKLNFEKSVQIEF